MGLTEIVLIIVGVVFVIVSDLGDKGKRVNRGGGRNED